MPMSFAIYHLSFVIEHVQLSAFLPTPRQSQPLAHAPQAAAVRLSWLTAQLTIGHEERATYDRNCFCPGNGR